MEKILISACLLGHRVRYDACSKYYASDILSQWQAEGRLIPFCSELAGGLKIPRAAAEIQFANGIDILNGQARIITTYGDDVTEAFINGAQQCLELARQHQISIAILKARSPSCGKTQIYDGSFSGTLVDGTGVTAALLESNGIEIFTESEIHLARQLIDRGRV